MNFDYVLAEDPTIFEEENKIRVVLCEPGENARIAEIGNDLKSLQDAVGGLIEVYYGLDDPSCFIVCNEEGKINGLEPCRGIYDNDGNIIEVICGPFFICSEREDGEFASLSEDDLQKYMQEFYRPETLVISNDNIAMIPYDKDLGDELEI